jgi:hypothetical protein
MGRRGFGISKKAPLIDTSGEPVDDIDKFNVSPPADNGETTLELLRDLYAFVVRKRPLFFLQNKGRGRVLNPQVHLGYTIRCSVRHPAKLALPIRIFPPHIDVRESLVTPNAATE